MITINLSSVTFLVMLGLSIISPILPQYAETFHVNYSLVGLVVAAFGIARMLADLPTGYLARKYNKKFLLFSGLILITISSIMAGFAYTYWILFIARLIEGIGSAIFVTTALVYLGQISRPERRGTLMSIYSSFLLLGSILGPSFGGIIAINYGIRAPFFAYALVITLGFIPTIFLPYVANPNKDNVKQSQSFLQEALSTFKDSQFLLVLPAIFALFFVRTGIRNTLIPLYTANDLGYNESQIGTILTIAAIATAVTMVPIGKLSDKFDRRIPLLLSLFLSVPISLLFPFTKTFFMVCLVSALYGAIIGLSGPIAAYITDVAPSNRLEIYLSVYRFIGDIGLIVGPLFTGALVDLTGVPQIVGEQSIVLVGWIPFALSSMIMLLAGIVLLKAPKSKINLEILISDKSE